MWKAFGSAESPGVPRRRFVPALPAIQGVASSSRSTAAGLKAPWVISASWSRSRASATVAITTSRCPSSQDPLSGASASVPPAQRRVVNAVRSSATVRGMAKWGGLLPANAATKAPRRS